MIAKRYEIYVLVMMVHLVYFTLQTHTSHTISKAVRPVVHAWQKIQSAAMVDGVY